MLLTLHMFFNLRCKYNITNCRNTNIGYKQLNGEKNRRKLYKMEKNYKYIKTNIKCII